jgi:hypothetical protein
VANAFERARVVKKISATQSGALKLARRYGDALVGVRYRHGTEKRHRYGRTGGRSSSDRLPQAVTRRRGLLTARRNADSMRAAH